jgi:hypothetical protein
MSTTTTSLYAVESPMEQFRALMAQDAALRVGQPVTVRWGYGLGFRARGTGTIVKLSPKSVQVQISAAVPSPSDPAREGWPAGFVLKGIPRVDLTSRNWNHWNCVEPLPERSLASIAS